MEKSLHSLKKTSELIRKIFLGLLVISSLFLLWTASAWLYGMFCAAEKVQVFQTASGGWSLSAGSFTVLIRQGYFAPSTPMEAMAKTTYLIESGMNLFADLFQWTVFFIAHSLFDTVQENPFSIRNGSYLRRIGALLCLGAVLPEIGKTVLFSALSGGCWSFFPGGLPVFSVLAWLVLFAVSKIFDYGCVLQKEHDETL